MPLPEKRAGPWSSTHSPRFLPLITTKASVPGESFQQDQQLLVFCMRKLTIAVSPYFPKTPQENAIWQEWVNIHPPYKPHVTVAVVKNKKNAITTEHFLFYFHFLK
jgi:hypothetical protein